MVLESIGRQITAIAAGALLLLATGCQDDEIAEITNCADLSGTYVAENVSVESVSDDNITADFEDAEWQLIFSGGNFTSEFAGPYGDVSASGDFTVTGDDGAAPSEIILGTTALFPNLNEGPQRFSCELDGNVEEFEITTLDIDYDFDQDGHFEEAQIDADFDRIDPAV